MKKIPVLLLTLSLVLLLVAACGGGGKEAPGGDMDPNAAAGKALFEQTTLEGNPGCVTCHSIEPGKTVVGPSMAGIASKGEDFIR
ncbi:MAG TPA: c-type cytochrome, partial [Anaerolineae bacterium]|nr:c-type cytochrome [Anaerolineae bacterium]